MTKFKDVLYPIKIRSGNSNKTLFDNINKRIGQKRRRRSFDCSYTTLKNTLKEVSPE